jgi:pimeloyl-ACP methyl ester carboxylesterase
MRDDVSPYGYRERMHVVERGSGIPLVLLHGFSVDHRLLLPLDPAIEAAGGWRRLYFDLPGHGLSAMGGAASTEDVVQVVEAEIRDRWRVVGVFDDRQQVVRMWRALGLTVFQVAEGDFQ